MIFSGTCTCAYQGVRNVSFSENFAYVLNEWSFYANQRKYELHLEKKKKYLENFEILLLRVIQFKLQYNDERHLLFSLCYT